MDSLDAATSLGFELPSAAYLIGALIFGLIGWGAWRYGGKMDQPKTRWIGLALMLYPYAISATWLMYAIGIALCGALYWFRD